MIMGKLLCGVVVCGVCMHVCEHVFEHVRRAHAEGVKAVSRQWVGIEAESDFTVWKYMVKL